MYRPPAASAPSRDSAYASFTDRRGKQLCACKCAHNHENKQHESRSSSASREGRWSSWQSHKSVQPHSHAIKSKLQGLNMKLMHHNSFASEARVDLSVVPTCLVAIWFIQILGTYTWLEWYQYRINKLPFPTDKLQQLQNIFKVDDTVTSLSKGSVTGQKRLQHINHVGDSCFIFLSHEPIFERWP